jgi:hypothetical protein
LSLQNFLLTCIYCLCWFVWSGCCVSHSFLDSLQGSAQLSRQVEADHALRNQGGRADAHLHPGPILIAMPLVSCNNPLLNLCPGRFSANGVHSRLDPALIPGCVMYKRSSVRKRVGLDHWQHTSCALNCFPSMHSNHACHVRRPGCQSCHQ